MATDRAAANRGVTAWYIAAPWAAVRVAAAPAEADLGVLHEVVPLAARVGLPVVPTRNSLSARVAVLLSARVDARVTTALAHPERELQQRRWCAASRQTACF